MNDDNQIRENDTDFELAEMFSDDNNDINYSDKSKEDVKKIVKKKNDSNEEGYFTVVGGVMIIISISFILSALFIRMLI